MNTLCVSTNSYAAISGEFPKGKFSAHRSMLLAALILHDDKREFLAGTQSLRDDVGRAEEHPDFARVAKQWQPAIGSRSDLFKEVDPNLILWLAVHVLSEWELRPKRTSSEHARLYKRIADSANDLRQLLSETHGTYSRGGGHGLEVRSVADLFTNQERSDILAALVGWYEQYPHVSKDGDVVEVNPSCYFPSVADILERLAQAANRLKSEGPAHSQPKKRGARTGYFIRRMASLLLRAYDEAPPWVLAGIASAVLGETVDDDLARKHMRLSERSAHRTGDNVPS